MRAQWRPVQVPLPWKVLSIFLLFFRKHYWGRGKLVESREITIQGPALWRPLRWEQNASGWDRVDLFCCWQKQKRRRKWNLKKKYFFRAIFLFRWDGGDVEEVVRGPGLWHNQLVRRDWHRCPNDMSLWCFFFFLKVVKWIILKWQFLQALQIQVGLLPWKWRSLPTATGQASHRPSGKATFTFLSKSPTRIAPSSPSSSRTRREARRRRSRRPSPRRWRRSKRLFWRKQLLSWKRKRGVHWRRTQWRKVRWNWNWILPPCLPPRLRHLLANPSDFLVSRKCYQIVTRGKCKLCVQIVW